MHGGRDIWTRCNGAVIRSVIGKSVPFIPLLNAVDAVVGGTMAREAAYLGLPAFSVFQGKIGGVDRRLAEQGRLTLLTSSEDIERLDFRRIERLPMLDGNQEHAAADRYGRARAALGRRRQPAAPSLFEPLLTPARLTARRATDSPRTIAVRVRLILAPRNISAKTSTSVSSHSTFENRRLYSLSPVVDRGHLRIPCTTLR